MNGFRLLAVHTEVERQSLMSFESGGAGERSVEISPGESSNSAGEPWVSVITGRNGLGKSRMLGGVAALFAGARSGRLSVRNRYGMNWRVEYSVGGDDCDLWTTGAGEVRATLNGRECPAERIPMPSAVIALSTTAMDKFPLPARNSAKDDRSIDDVYSYMGLRDPTGRASATAVVYRALEALVEATEATHERRVRISRVFDFLGYAPRVEHTYRWRYSSVLRAPDSLTQLLQSQPGSMADRNVAARLRRIVDKDPALLEELQGIVNVVRASTAPRRELHLAADFSSTHSAELARFRDVQLLRRAGLVELSSVELERSDTGLKVDLREVSSGELSLATAFLGLAAVIQDDALVLIDEPEVSLHPEWQSQYLGLLTQIFANYRGCHFVVATHSPLVVSDISATTGNVVSLDPHRKMAEDGANYAGDSVDEVLVRAFDVVGKNNLFVKQRLVEALRLAADGEVLSPQFADAIAPLAQLTERLEPGSPVKDLIEQLVEAREASLS